MSDVIPRWIMTSAFDLRIKSLSHKETSAETVGRGWGTSFVAELLAARMNGARSLRPLSLQRKSRKGEKWELEKNWRKKMRAGEKTEFWRCSLSSLVKTHINLELLCVCVCVCFPVIWSKRFPLLVKPIWVEFSVFWDEKIPTNITLFWLFKNNFRKEENESH